MGRRLAGLPIVCVFLAAAACGGKDRARPSGEPHEPSPPGDRCAATDGYEFLTILDFDYTTPGGQMQCDPRVWIPPSSDPVCAFLNTDMTCVESIRPGQIEDVISPGRSRNLSGSPVDGGRCNVETSALHIYAKNVSTCYVATGRLGWGMSIEVLLSTSAALDAAGAGSTSGVGGGSGAGGAGPGEPGANGFDASNWDGISFWVKRGQDISGEAFIVTVSDPATSGPPFCSTVDGVPDAEKCDAFGLAVTLSDEWTLITAPFSSMRQKGFGVPAPSGRIDNGNISRLNILASAGDWDFWVDEVAFYRAAR
jgi:hypothetical protein